MSDQDDTRDTDSSPINQEDTIALISSLLDSKLNKSVNELKSVFQDQELETKREIKKIKSDSKAASSFKFKGNRLQF